MTSGQPPRNLKIIPASKVDDILDHHYEVKNIHFEHTPLPGDGT